MANATEKINQIINSLDNKIIELEKRETINVAMRIDEVVPYLKNVLAIAQDDVSSRKFDITTSVTGSATLTFTKNGDSVSAGSNVLSYGDTLVITAAAGTGYEIKSLKVNGADYTSGTSITVTTDINVVVVAELLKYSLTITEDDNTTVSVTLGGVAVTAGATALSYGDVITISASAGEGYTLSTLTVNGNDFVSGQTVTVSANVTIVAASTVTPTPEE